jgi:diguanylate cyclase (GGDEF)-like protein/PAS domain S-box-containing protein
MNTEISRPQWESEHTFRLLIDSVQDYAIYKLDAKGHVVTWNRGAQKIKGYSAGEIIGKYYGCFFSDEDRSAEVPKALLDEAALRGRVASEGWRVRKDGSRFWASIILSAIYDEDGQINGFAKVTRDLTERKEKEELLRASEAALHAERDRLKVTLYSIADGVIGTDEQTRITLMNPAAEFMTGWSLDKAKGRPIDEIFRVVKETTADPIRNPVHQCFARNDVHFLEDGAMLIGVDGSSRAIQDSAAPLRNASGETIGAVIVFHDVSRIREAQREVEFHSNHDAVTTLPNRRAFEIWLSELFRQTQITEIESAVCFLNLDHFKVINDTVGHEAGDMLLRTVANLLLRHVRDLDMVARLGGDEFGIVLMGCTVEDAQGTLQEMLKTIRAYEFVWDGDSFRISASIGVAALKPTTPVAEVMKEADVACYAAKRSGRNRIKIYDSIENEAREQHLEFFIAADLKDAIRDERFFLHAQKIVAANGSDGAHRYELLLRLRDEHGEIIQPQSFIPTAERYEMMSELDRWVFDQVLSRYSASLLKIPDLHLHLNLSANSLNDASFLPFALKLLEHSKLPASALVIEITESALMNNLFTARAIVNELQAAGCEIALDDFGMGFCSFGYLRNFSVDYVKIEGSFIRNMLHSKVDFAIVKAINNIAHEIEARTIAEFVESEEILSRVKRLGMDYAQGYALGRPAPIEEIFGIKA